MPERRPPERRPPHEPPTEDEHAPFLDGPEPDWVERLHQNRKAQVKRWERVFGTGDHDAAGDGPADRTSGEAPARRDAPTRRGASPARRRLRRTDGAERKATPEFFDQDEQEPPGREEQA
jgi:hypothetical protein